MKLFGQNSRSASANPVDEAVHTIRQQAKVIADGDHLHPVVDQLQCFCDVVLRALPDAHAALPGLANDRRDRLIERGMWRFWRKTQRSLVRK
jgi:hypothetical protein